MKKLVHRSAAITATLCIALFFSSTIFVELLGSYESIATLKSLIVTPGLFILVPAIAMTSASGLALAKSRDGILIKSKISRMPFIAINGLVILLPAAIFLNIWAASGMFDTRFYLVQGLELIVGLINLTLMGMNMRDGLKLSGKISARL